MKTITTSSPRWFAIPALLALALIVIPPVMIVVRTPWDQVVELLSSPTAWEALRISVVTATISTVLCLLTGIPLAWLLTRGRFRGRQALDTVVTIPLVLPPVVAGVALLFTFGRTSPLGSFLEEHGLGVPFTGTAVVLAQTFVALPLLVTTLKAGILGCDISREETAATLGASFWYRARRIVLPQLAPALLTGIALCWARAFGEFGATITFAGSIPGLTQTLPIAINQNLGIDPGLALTMSVLMLAVSLCVLIFVRQSESRAAR